MSPAAKPRKARRPRPETSPSRIIRAAEDLFASRSIDSVSMREIATAAGCANNNAVQYHFGSKDGLLYAIFNARVRQMEPLRLQMLAVATEAGSLDDPVSLLSILFLPHLELADADGRHPYAAFLLQFATRIWAVDPKRWSSSVATTPGLFTVMEHLHAIIDEPSQHLRSLRIMLCNMMFMSTLVRWDNSEDSVRLEVPLQRRVRDVLHSSAASLTCSSSHTTSPTRVSDWLAAMQGQVRG